MSWSGNAVHPNSKQELPYDVLSRTIEEHSNPVKKGNQRSRISNQLIPFPVDLRAKFAFVQGSESFIKLGGLIDNAPVTCSRFDRIHFIGYDRAAAAAAGACSAKVPVASGRKCVRLYPIVILT